MPRRALPVLLPLLLAAIPACGPRPVEQVTLTGRAVLPADTYTAGSGGGRGPQRRDQRAQGAVPRRAGAGLQLAHRHRPRRGRRAGPAGQRLRHPGQQRRLPPALVRAAAAPGLPAPQGRPGGGAGLHAAAGPPTARQLTGGDYDPEGFVRLADGSFWIGDEFGPWLLHFGDDGRPAGPTRAGAGAPPAACPTDAAWATCAPPTIPTCAACPTRQPRPGPTCPAAAAWRAWPSARDGKHIYVAVEKALLDDPDPRRRLILEFDPARGAFTDRFWTYRVDTVGVSVASLEAVTDRRAGADRARRRGGGAGRRSSASTASTCAAPARTACWPRPWRRTCWTSTIPTPDRVRGGRRRPGPATTRSPTSPPSAWPCLDPSTLLVACDNNYPFSTGRRPGTPDDTEFIRLRLPVPLDREPSTP